MTTLYENEQLNDEWQSDARDYSQTTEWIACGDHVVGCAQRVLYCVDMYTGAEKSGGVFPLRLGPFGDPNLAYSNGVVYFMGGASGDELQAISIPKNAPVSGWVGGTYGGVASLQAVSGVLVVVFTGDEGQTLVAGLSLLDGTPLWASYTINTQSPGLIGLGDQAAYFVVGNTLNAVNVGSGNVRFSQATPNPNAQLDQTHPPLCIGTMVLCGGDAVYAFDYRKGTCLWQALSGSGGGWTLTPADPGYVIASGGSGQIVRVKIADASVETPAQTVPTPGDPIVMSGNVYVIGSDNSLLYAFDLLLQEQLATYSFGTIAGAAPLVGNGGLFVATSDGILHAMPFASQDAAYFDGVTGYFEVQQEHAEFDLALADFSIELWARSSVGGELLCTYPTKSDGYGIRFNLGANGELQFAVADENLSDADLWATGPTTAADGFWHHLAAVRSRGELTLYVDSTAYNVARAYRRANAKVNPYFLEQQAQCAPLPISGANTLVGAAYKSSASSAPSEMFVGLMREVRIWTRALDAASLQSRMYKNLNFLTSGLLGNWHLDDDWSGAPGKNEPLVNEVQGYDLPGTFYAARSLVSDFATDDTGYPFLLEKEALPWPYQSEAHWAACGEKALSAAPVIGASGTVAFGDPISLYGVDKQNGARRWGVPMPEGYSVPVADGNTFVALTWEFGVLSIDTLSGAYETLTAFEGVVPREKIAGVTLCPPVSTNAYLAAAGPTGAVYVQTRKSGDAPMILSTANNPANLQISGDTLGVFASASIYLANCVSSTVSAQVAADVPYYYLDAQRLVCVQKGVPACYLASNGYTKPAYTGTPLAGQVTGMAASSDGSLLVVTTDSGVAYGLCMGSLAVRWKNNSANSKGPSAFFAPAFGDNYVAIAAANGTIVALDPNNGELVARYEEIHGIVTPATVDNNTLYYGCADDDASGLRDGALHSVALGRTYALRLGVTPSDTRGYAAVASKTPMRLFVSNETSVEAWINTQTGGEICTVLPANTPQSFYARLFLDATGSVGFEFASRAAATDPWSAGAWRSAPTVACEGKWHHVAVCVNGVGDVRLYLDGRQQTFIAQSAPTIPGVTADTQVFIGAGVPNAAGSPTAFYSGMIAEVRLWDDYLTAAEISDRMHDKLVGDEPDLIAYWNFDAKMVHDSARNGYDGTLVSEGDDADYWLTDLTFSPPSYPTFTTTATMRSQDASGTVYELTIATLKADKTPISGALSLWYIVPPGSSQPASIQMSTLTGQMTPVTGFPPGGDTDPAKAFSCSTDGTGSVTLLVQTTDTTAGPTLDLLTSYMYPNERYHLDALVNNQNFTRPPAPTLTFQATMLQDYTYVHGDTVNSDNHRNTYSVVLSAKGPDGSPLIAEAVSIWAESPLAIEVGGVAYNITDSNAASVTTDGAGEVKLIIEAVDVHCPALLAWAGFMQRDDRLKVAPDNDATSGLSAVHGGDLNRVQTQEWRPDSEGGPKTASVLTGDYQQHADDISQTVRHVMAAGQGSSASTSVAALRARRGVRSRPPFADMRQLPPLAGADAVAAMRTMMHIDRRQPLTPEFALHSLHQVDPTAIGFHFVCRGDISTFSFSLIHSQEEAAAIKADMAARHAARAAVAGKPQLLGSIWDDIVDAADDVWHAAEELAITIGNTVEAAISTAEGVLTTVINDIASAALAIGNFFKQLAIDLVNIIKFLLSFFDWGEICAIAKLLVSYGDDAIDQSIAYVQSLDLPDKVESIIAWLKNMESTLTGAAFGIDSVNQARTAGPNTAASGTGTVQGRYAQNKVSQFGPESDMSLVPNSADPFPVSLDTMAAGFVKAITDFVMAIPDVGSMSIGDFMKMLGTIVTDVLNPLIDTLADVLMTLAGGIGDLLSGAKDALDTSIDIPFLSELYKWITGGQNLSFASLSAMMMAVPLNVMCEIVYQAKFTDLTPDQLPPLYGQARGELGASSAEFNARAAYITSSVLMGISQGIADVFTMLRMQTQYPESGAQRVPCSPGTPELMANIALSLSTVLNVAAKPDLSSGERLISVFFYMLKVAYSSCRIFKPAAGTVEWYDELVPYLTSVGAMAAIVLAFELNPDMTDEEKAGTVLWAIPQIYRPVVNYPVRNPYVIATIGLLDVACFTTGGALTAPS